jgi:hypothetical protein
MLTRLRAPIAEGVFEIDEFLPGIAIRVHLWFFFCVFPLQHRFPCTEIR